jgi:hypothetical protein
LRTVTQPHHGYEIAIIKDTDMTDTKEKNVPEAK